MSKILSIDPGQKKCGLLIADIKDLRALSAQIVERTSVIDFVKEWQEQYAINLILLGNGTSSEYWHSQLLIYQSPPIKLVEERNTTLRARQRYWELFPPRFLLKFVISATYNKASGRSFALFAHFKIDSVTISSSKD